jgi:hypothetical protein
MIMQLVQINLNQGPTKKNFAVLSFSYAATCPLLNSPNRIIPAPAQVDDGTTIYKIVHSDGTLHYIQLGALLFVRCHALMF